MLGRMTRRVGSRFLAVIVGGFLLGLSLGMVRGQQPPEPPAVVEPVDAPLPDDRDAPCPRAVGGPVPHGCDAEDGPVFFVQT